MLSEFLQTNRETLVEMCRAKAALRAPDENAGTDHGIPELIDQLIEIFRLEQTPAALARHAAGPRRRPSLVLVPSEVTSSATRKGAALRHTSLTVDLVVHGYGDLCQALTELAMERDAPISVDEFHTFNRCLDDAIADAVTAFSREPGAAHMHDAPEAPLTSRGEMRALVDGALMSFAVIRAGKVGLTGTTANIHEDCLVRLRDLLRSAAGQPGTKTSPP